MYKNTFGYKLILMLSFVSFNFLTAQTDEQKREIIATYDHALLSQMANEFSLAFENDLKAARVYAMENNLPTVIFTENGGMSKLHKVLEDGTLLYLSTDNRGAGVTVRANKLYTGPSGGLNLSVEGTGMTLGVWDGGKVLDTHELLVDRVTQQDGSTTLSNHATHVSGTMIGSNVPASGQARGMAFRASLNAYDFDNDLSEMTTAAANGLLISNHSYGLNAEFLPTYYFGRYDNLAVQVDNILYNAPYYTAVFSAGNDRNAGYNTGDNGYDLLTDRGVSKNGITVAAVNQVNNYTGPSSVVMSSFSSWGPTDDGRIKPDISAKGVNTYSSVATSNTAYGSMNGTSMATPSVSGSLGLLQELYSDIHGNFMKSSTLRALAIHTASEAGVFPGPDYQFGWGLLDCETAAITILEEEFQSLIEENSLADGATFTKSVTALGTEPLVVTIAWTDPAGTVQGTTVDDTTPRLVNDLDLRVVDASNNTTYPWALSAFSYTSPAIRSVNNVDNVEKVEIDVPSGDYTIIVNHKGTLDSGNQDFALIVTGISESDFAFTPENITKTFCADEVGDYYFNYSSSDTYNGPTTLSVTGLPAGAVATFTPSVITADEDFTLEISGLDSVTPGTYSFDVVATGTSDTKTRQMEIEVLSADPISDVTLNYPSAGESGVYIYPGLTWDAVSGASGYKVEVSELSDFSTLIFEDTVEANTVSVPALNSNTQYYWRVMAFSECVDANFVSSSFTTEAVNCSISSTANDNPQPIDTVPNTVTSIINVPAGQDILVGDINVTVNLSHTWMGDLTVSLTSPSGTSVVLFSNACDDLDDTNVTFDDSGVEFSCSGTVPALSGTMQPQNLLTPFIGENAAGDWTLTVNDGYDEDGGFLNSFSLELCSTAGPLSVADKELEGFAIYPNPAKNHFEFTLLNQQENVKVGVYDINGRLLISKSFNTNERKLVSVENLSSGMYFVEVINGQQKGVKKLMVK